MKAIISVWMQPVYARINTASLKVLYALLGVVALIPLLVMLLAAGQKLELMQVLLALVIGVGSVLALALLLWFILLVPSIALQYTPSNAGLVPGMKPQMQLALAVPVLLIPAIISLAISFKSPEYFFISWLLGVVVFLMYCATLRSKWAALLIVLMMQLPMLLEDKFSRIDQSSWNQPILLLLAGLGLTALVLHWIFAIHGDQHFKREENFAAMQKVMNGQEMGTNQQMLNFVNLYGFLLRLCLERVRKAPDKVGQLIPFSLGWQAFWLSNFLSVTVMSMGLSIYFILFMGQSSKFDDKNMVLAYFAALVSYIILPPIYVSIARHSAQQRRLEQGLLMLAANLPSAQEQSKIMLGFLLRQFFGLWLMTVLVVGTTVHFSPASQSMAEMVWIICFSLLPLSLMSLTNYARINSVYQTAMLTAYGVPFILGLASLGLHKLMPGLPVWLICGWIVTVTLATLGRRWKQLMQVSAVFPAGRAA
ncbi:hypothetical protein ACO0LC_25890 [Undibacterium sp. JH2W]|uniref:hypothetical protein n=1 Tax=Undibacterium sp. JH2W TaxID=3413037 RepID=UPI003BF11397